MCDLVPVGAGTISLVINLTYSFLFPLYMATYGVIYITGDLSPGSTNLAGYLITVTLAASLAIATWHDLRIEHSSPASS